MKTEKNQIEIEENQPVDKSRRRAIGAGIAAPVIMTLASKPVFAMQDLSNILSTGSQAAKRDCFSGGFSHGRWKQETKPDEWRIATQTSGTDYKTYKMNQLFSKPLGGTHNLPSDMDSIGMTGDSTVLAVLNKNGQPSCQIVSGALNLMYYKYAPGNVPYFMTESQFWDLNDNEGAGTTKIPTGLVYTKTNKKGETTTKIVNSFATLIEFAMDKFPAHACPL